MSFSTGAFVAGQRSDEVLDGFYRAHQWFELRTSVTGRTPVLLRGAVEVAFNHPAEAERLLRSVIRGQAKSSEADDAYYLLSRIYLRSGQYARLMNTYRAWRASLPDSPQLRGEQQTIDKLSGRPDQINERIRPTTVRHEADSYSIPVSINGKADDFLADTGAWTSVLTEREAKKFGLTIQGEVKTMTGASGDTTKFRTAVAKDVLVGATLFHDVSFAVLEPTGPLADVEGGIVGMPILLGLGTISWSKNGTADLGRVDIRPNALEPNLVFEGDRLLLRLEVLGARTFMTLDTGADTTDLNANFAERFPADIQRGKRATHDITGAGGTQTFESVELSELVFGIGQMRPVLQPAYVTLQRIGLIGGNCCIGNVGRDVLTQRQVLSIDLSSMILEMK
jgi:predicted aspartyl protease